jgi:hypothetical protein
LVAALHQSWVLLAHAPERLAKLEAVVQQELGANRQLWVKVLGSKPRTAICTEAALRQRGQALVAVSDCVWGLAACMAVAVSTMEVAT